MSTKITCGNLAATLNDKSELGLRGPAAAVVQHAIDHAELDLWDHCLGAGRPNKLTVIRTGRSHPDFRVQDFSRHARWCPCPVGSNGSAAKTTAGFQGPLVMDDLVLGAAAPETEEVFWNDPEARKVPSDFGCWISEAVSHSVTTSMIDANPGLHRLEVLASKSPEFLLRSISERLSRGLIEGRGSVVGALAAKGECVVLGWTIQPLAQNIAELRLGERINSGHGEASIVGSGACGPFASISVHYPSAVGSFIHGRAQSQNGYYAAPYFFAALGKLNRWVLRASRVYLHPVHGLPNSVTFNDSGPENDFTSVLRSAHFPYLKPPRLFDLNRLLAMITCLGSKPLVLRYRPDFLIFYRGVLFIVEVSGRRDPEYLAQMDKKMDYYDGLKDQYRALALKFDATNLPDPTILAGAMNGAMIRMGWDVNENGKRAC